jgi:hypothetical protein
LFGETDNSVLYSIKIGLKIATSTEKWWRFQHKERRLPFPSEDSRRFNFSNIYNCFLAKLPGPPPHLSVQFY